jgi:hypothetical protein
MLNWLKDNSAALQGLAAVLGPILTVIIIAITWRYVRLTNSIATTTHLQLSATLQPVVDMTFGKAIYGDRWKVTYNVSISLTMRNKGKAPVKIKRLYLVAQLHTPPTGFKQLEFEINKNNNRVLMPDETLSDTYMIDDQPTTELHTDNVIFGARIDCTDLTEQVMHTFYFHPSRGVRHSSTLNDSPTMLKSLVGAGRWLKEWAEWDHPPTHSQKDK